MKRFLFTLLIVFVFLVGTVNGLTLHHTFGLDLTSTWEPFGWLTFGLFGGLFLAYGMGLCFRRTAPAEG